MSDVPPLEVDKQPVPGGNVNKPASGTYGEQASQERLESALPGVSKPPPPGGPGPQVASVPPRGPGPIGAGAESPVRGVPLPILKPTDRPNVPVNTPAPDGPPGAGVPNFSPQQDRLRILYAMAQSEDPEIREWAEIVIEHLTT